MIKCDNAATSTFPASCANYPGKCSDCNQNGANKYKDAEWGWTTKGSNHLAYNGNQ